MCVCVCVSFCLMKSWSKSKGAVFNVLQTWHESFATPIKEDVVVQLSAAPEWLIRLGLSMSNPNHKKSQVLLIMPAWVSLALQIYQMKLIGNTLRLCSWETCLSGVTFLLRFPDSMQCWQPRWKMREYILGGGYEWWIISTRLLTVPGHVLWLD